MIPHLSTIINLFHHKIPLAALSPSSAPSIIPQAPFQTRIRMLEFVNRFVLNLSLVALPSFPQRPFTILWLLSQSITRHRPPSPHLTMDVTTTCATGFEELGQEAMSVLAERCREAGLEDLFKTSLK